MTGWRKPGAWRPVRKPRREDHLEHVVADRLEAAGRDTSKAARIAAGRRAAHEKYHATEPRRGCELCDRRPSAPPDLRVTRVGGHVDPLPDPSEVPE